MANAQTDKTKETKEAKFKRLANRRVAVALKRLGHIKSLSNRSSYAYTPDQVAKITTVLREALKNVEDAFSGQKETPAAFTL
jgi:hypothetical protein